jgi:hypothetical protein
MTRINVYSHNDEWDYEGTRTLAGWFDSEKADRWTDGDYNGNGSGGTGRGQAVYRTAQGRWVLCNWSNWQDEANRYEFIEPEQAREWLLRNGDDAAVAEHFGPVEEERGPGRPKIGGEALLRLGDDLLGQIDAYATEQGQSRAEVVRIALGEFLTGARPYAVTVRDISTGNREEASRHTTLGAAVTALREEQAYDNEDNGLPSRYPRVEHDGRPIDVEAYSD